ncbi:uncharacterized protein NPIL_73631, partial [Nephila pilipes]
VRRETFCNKYSHLCQKPNNLTELCKTHPDLCKGDVSDLVIPKLEYYANNSEDEALDTIMEIYTNNILQDGAPYWSWDKPIQIGGEREMKTTFIYDHERLVYMTCYSANLHIYGSEEVETTHSDSLTPNDKTLNSFETSIRDEETFYPWTVPRIYLSIHSPFVPIHPFIKGTCLEKYREYIINIQIVSTIFNKAVYV